MGRINSDERSVFPCPSFIGRYAVMLILAIHFSGPLAWAGHMVKIGVLEEPKTINTWLASDRWSRKVLSLIHQSLYVRDPETLSFIPWLAESDPVYDETTLCYTVNIRPAKWSDGSEVTSEDVAFTGRFVQEFKVPRYASRWEFVKRIETPDDRTVKFFLKKPQAIFLSRTLTTPIVQKRLWAGIAESARKSDKPLSILLTYKIEKPIGCGPFVLKEWRRGAYLFLQTNPHFFGKGQDITGRTLGPFVDGIIFKIYGTSDAAILAMKKGDIDMMWWGIQAGYLEDLKAQKDIRLFFNEKSALYYMGFNVRKAPFDDIHLRNAVAFLIDKDFIISRVLQGGGIKMISVVPPGNRFWHCPEVPLYGEGMSREQRIRKACQILQDAGYTWEVQPIDKTGKVIKGEGIRLPNGHPMKEFTILTPPADYDPHRAMCGLLIQEWLREVGFPASSRPMAFGALIQQVKVRHQFDTFILGYGSLSLDPDYIRNFFHSRNDKARGQNMSGYTNPYFDRIADASAATMDPLKRQKLIWDMQKTLMQDVPYIPLYNPNLVEAVRTDRYDGWVEMLEGIGNIWSFCQIKPR